MTHRLTYARTSRYAHLNAAAFPTSYPDREAAEQARAHIVASQTPRRDDIEIVDEEDE